MNTGGGWVLWHAGVEAGRHLRAGSTDVLHRLKHYHLLLLLCIATRRLKKQRLLLHELARGSEERLLKVSLIR